MIIQQKKNKFNFVMNVFLALFFMSSLTIPAYAQVDTLLSAGDKALVAGKYELAFALYKKAFEKGANKAIISFKLGNVFYKQGKMADAIREFKNTIVLAPYFKNVYHNLSTLYYSLEEYYEATLVLRDFLQKSPDDSETELLLGSLFCKMRDFTKAEKYFYLAMAHNPDMEDPYIELCYMYLDLNDLEMAIYYIEEGIKKIPESLLFRETLAQLYMEKMEFKKAASIYSALLGESTNLSKEQRYDFICEEANAFQQAGLTNLAIARLHEAIEMNPKQGRAIEMLKYVFLSSEKIMEGLSFFDKLYSQNPKESYLGVKDLFTIAYNKENKVQLKEFVDFYETHHLTDELFIYVKESY